MNSNSAYLYMLNYTTHYYNSNAMLYIVTAPEHSDQTMLESMLDIWRYLEQEKSGDKSFYTTQLYIALAFSKLTTPRDEATDRFDAGRYDDQTNNEKLRVLAEQVGRIECGLNPSPSDECKVGVLKKQSKAIIDNLLRQDLHRRQGVYGDGDSDSDDDDDEDD